MVATRFGLMTVMMGEVSGHGHMTYPPSTRQGYEGMINRGQLSQGAYCVDPWGKEEDVKFWHHHINGACMLFSQPSEEYPDIAILKIPPTLNESKYRTVNTHISGGKLDWTRVSPWRAPGWAPVFGEGCGVAGGGPVWVKNGGWPGRGMTQGQDALSLPAPQNGPETTWVAGSVVEVAFGIKANHGGGYSWRLCKNVEGEVSEECFQKTPLKFASEKSWLHHRNGMRFEIPSVTVKEGTFPEGSEWKRVPYPECDEDWVCPESPEECKEKMGLGDVCHKYAFAEPLPNLHGFGHDNNSAVMGTFHDYSIVDHVTLPADLETGDYFLSWRWDCEATTQIWQNCADVHIVGGKKPSPPPAPLEERCDLTGTWRNMPVDGKRTTEGNYRVNITQDGATWASACFEGDCGCCADAAGGVASPYGDYPKGASSLYVHLIALLSSGNFTTAAAKGATACSQIDWEEGNSWCKEPFCPSDVIV